MMSAVDAPPPVPGSIMRVLLSTSAWAVLGAIGMLLIGILQLFSAKKAWDQVSESGKLPVEEFGTLERIIGRADAIVNFAVAAACLYVVPRLLRYSAAISRLREARRVAELENALRHQRAVWTAFGVAGILWMISFVGQILYFINVVQDLQEIREMEAESDTYRIESPFTE